MPHSIRWRLPASYGAIALLTIISLGGLLLFMLNSFYTSQERRYLEQNAPAVGQMISSLLDTPGLSNISQEDLLQSQINSLAYLIQTRIRLFDSGGVLQIDSGSPESLRVSSTLSLQLDIGDEGQSFSQSIGRESDDQFTSALVIEDEGGRFESQTTVSGSLVDPATGVDGQAFPLIGLQPPSALGLAESSNVRSEAMLFQSIVNQDGQALGEIQLSEGPAFGRSILAGVARALAIAGIVAVLLATLVGWLISRRLTRPVLALVQATEQMSTGDLSVRAEIDRQDELGQLARSFNRMARQIETTVATLRNFVADAAHEMNTPLTALRTNLELASRDRAGDAQLSAALEQAARLENLNDDLVQLSRLEGGIGLEGAGPVDLAGLAKRLGESYAAQAEQASLDFELVVSTRPLIVNGDQELLIRAVNNLVDNAIKFTPQGGHVALMLDGHDSWAWIEVVDSGIGIEEADLDLVFGRFHRGRNAAAYPGSGLGLAISQSIVNAHGGRIEVASQPGRTQVKAYLPAQNPA